MLLFTHQKIQICLFFLAMGTFQGMQGEEIECQDLKQITADESFILSLPSVSHLDSPTSIWYKPSPSSATESKLELKFGEYEWLVEYTKRFLKFTFKKSGRKMIDSRMFSEIFSPLNWTRLTLSSQSGYHFDIKDEMFDVQLGDLEMDVIDSIEISGAIATVSTSCFNNKERQRTTTTTSLPPEQTTTTTTDTTTLTTTLLPTPAPDPTTVPSDNETVTEEDRDDQNYTIDNLPVKVPITSKENLDGHECINLPAWVWGCLTAMIVFLVLSVILLVYVILLHRRNKSLMAPGDRGEQTDSLPGRLISPGGYGQQSKDLQFFKPGNNESIVAIAPQPSLASYTHTINMPPGNQISPNVQFSTDLRTSEYKRSISCPERSPSISFPPPPSTPPPERNETVPLFSPNGCAEINRTSSHREKHCVRTSSRRKKPVKECFDADDESSAEN